MKFDKCFLRIKKSGMFKSTKDFINQKGLIWLLRLLFLNLLLIMFSVYTLLSVVLLSLITYFLIKQKWNKLRKDGLLRYLPSPLRTLLMKRSFFDVLCDLWFYPRLSLIFKAILTPFFISVEPENAINQLDILSETDRKMILTKGVVYILPKWIRHMLLPQNFKLHKKIHEFMDGDTEPPIAYNEESFVNNSNSFLSVKQKVDLLESPRKTEHLPYLKTGKTKNRLIISSKMLKNLNHLPGKITEKWDNLGIYKEKIGKKKKSRERSALFGHESVCSDDSLSQNSDVLIDKTKKHRISPLDMIMNLIELKKQKVLKKFSQKFLVGLFLATILVFGVNLGFSKRYRRITKSILLNASYGLILGLGAFSCSAILMKLKAEKQVDQVRV